jgi:hypothetical protein
MRVLAKVPTRLCTGHLAYGRRQFVKDDDSGIRLPRKIYALAFIQPEVMLNDSRTLYLESSVRKKGGVPRDRYASQFGALIR